MKSYTYLAMGRRRPWMLVGTVGGALGYAAMAQVADPISNLGLLTAFMVGGNLFLALQDIATDALKVDIVPLDDQAQANSLMWGSRALGTSATAVAAAWLLGRFGPSITFAVAAVVTLSFTLIPLFLRERPGERMLPWTSGKASAVAKNLTIVRLGRHMEKLRPGSFSTSDVIARSRWIHSTFFRRSF